MEEPRLRLAWLSGMVAAAAWCPASAQDMGSVLREQEIATGTGGFTGALDDRDHFGHALASLGDLDGDGIADVAVGAPEDDDGGTDRGAVWIAFLDAAGTVRGQSKISSTQGGFTGLLGNFDRFGCAVASLGDLGGDGTLELAVGAERDDDGAPDTGSVWILSLDSTGTVVASTKIGPGSGGFAGTLFFGDRFGGALATLDDLDGDGVPELAVGARFDDDGGTDRGAVWVLFLAPDGTVKSHAKISSTSGGGLAGLADQDSFGVSLAVPGDLDGDGLRELAVGAERDDDGGTDAGAVWVLFLASDGSVRAETKLSGTAAPALVQFDHFGASLAAPGDVDGDGHGDLAVGAPLDDDGGLNTGAVWILFLSANGSMRGSLKISALTGGLQDPPGPVDQLGLALAGPGDLDGDRMLDLLVGVPFDDSGGRDRGAFRTLFLETADQSSAVALTVRNGLDVNPVILTGEEPPVIGGEWRVYVDCTGFRRGVIIHRGGDRPQDGRVLPRLGQVLIDWSRPVLLRGVFVHFGMRTPLRYRVPDDTSLVGLEFFSQALVTGRRGAHLTNALDGVVQAP